MIWVALIVWVIFGFEWVLLRGEKMAAEGTRRQQIWFTIIGGPLVWVLMLWVIVAAWLHHDIWGDHDGDEAKRPTHSTNAQSRLRDEEEKNDEP